MKEYGLSTPLDICVEGSEVVITDGIFTLRFKKARIDRAWGGKITFQIEEKEVTQI